MQRLTQLKRIREQAGMSQVELAALAGVGHATVEVLETRPRSAQGQTVRKLAAALGVQPADLMEQPVVGAGK